MGALKVHRDSEGRLVVGQRRGRFTERDEASAALTEAPADSKPGEVYELGDHRLLCGDCRSVEQMLQLVGDETASAMWTDPPYGVGYTGGGSRKPIAGDERDGDLVALLTGAFRAADAVLAPRAAFYIASPPGSFDFLFALREVGWTKRQTLVWVKDRFVLGHSDYHYRHEDILYGHVPSNGRAGRGRHEGTTWRGDNAQDSVFEFPRPTRSVDHPTMKPVDLIFAHLRNSLGEGEIVLDPFAGSGSTMVAAEMLGARAFMIELDPHYCDVVRRRYDRLA